MITVGALLDVPVMAYVIAGLTVMGAVLGRLMVTQGRWQRDHDTD